MSEHPNTVITPSALFTHSRILSPIPSKHSTTQSINHLTHPATHQAVMLGTPPYSYQSYQTNGEFFSPSHTFVMPYIATAPHLALDESMSQSIDEDEWLNDYDGSKTPDFMDENNQSNPSSPYFVESDLSTISDDRSVDQHYEENGEVFDQADNQPVDRSMRFPSDASIFEEPRPVIRSIKQSINSYNPASIPIDLPKLEAVPASPVHRPIYQSINQPISQSVIVTLKPLIKPSNKKPSNKISSSQSVADDYPSDMSRSLAIVKGTRSYGDLQSLKKWSKPSKGKSSSTKSSSKQSSKGTPRQASGNGEGQHNQQQSQGADSGNNQSNQSTGQSNGQPGLPVADPHKTPGKSKRAGGKRKRGDNSSDSEGHSLNDSSSDDDGISSSSEEEVIDEHGNKVKKPKSKSKKKLKALSKRERNKLSAKAYRQRKKNATCELSEKNAALQRIVDQQARLLADAQLESERAKEQMGVLQSLLSIKITDLWQSRPAGLDTNEPGVLPIAAPAARPTGSGSPFAPLVPALGAMSGGFPGESSLGSGSERSALAMREGEELTSGALNQRTGMFLLALFSCFLLFNPGVRRATLAPQTGMNVPPTPSSDGVLNTLAEAAIKSESDTSTSGFSHAPQTGLPILSMHGLPDIKAEPLTAEQMAAYLAASQASNPFGQPAVHLPLLVDAQGVLHEWLVTADEHAMAQLRALTYEPLVRALGQDIANRAIREFAASFARQLD